MAFIRRFSILMKRAASGLREPIQGRLNGNGANRPRWYQASRTALFSGGSIIRTPRDGAEYAFSYPNRRALPGRTKSQHDPLYDQTTTRCTFRIGWI